MDVSGGQASTICVDLIESCCCVAEVTRQPLVELRQCRPELLKQRAASQLDEKSRGWQRETRNSRSSMLTR